MNAITYQVGGGLVCQYCSATLAEQCAGKTCGRCLVLRNMMRLRPDAAWRIIREIFSAQNHPN